MPDSDVVKWPKEFLPPTLYTHVTDEATLAKDFASGLVDRYKARGGRVDHPRIEVGSLTALENKDARGEW